MFPIRNNYKIYESKKHDAPFLEKEFRRLSQEYLNKYSIFRNKTILINKNKIALYLFIMSDNGSKVRSILALDFNKNAIIRYLFGELNDFHYLIRRVSIMSFPKIIYMFPCNDEILKIAKLHGFEVARTEQWLLCAIKTITF